MLNTEENKFECLFSFCLSPKGFLYLWANGIANFSPILFAFSQIELYRIEKGVVKIFFPRIYYHLKKVKFSWAKSTIHAELEKSGNLGTRFLVHFRPKF